MNKKINNSFVLCTVVYPTKPNTVNSESTERNFNNIEILPLNKWFRCKVCEKVFDRKSSLVLHERTHLDDRPLTCKVCQKTFLDKSLLNKHLITQGHIKSTEGDKGRNNDRFKDSLTGHRRELTSDKPFKCHICVETFKEELTLKNHLNLHVGNCRKTFARTRCKGKIIESNNCAKTSETKNLSIHCPHQEALDVCQEKKGTEMQLNSAERTCDMFPESLKIENSLSEHSCLSEKNSSNCTLSSESPVLKSSNNIFVCKVCLEVLKSENLFSEHKCSRVQSFNCDVTVSEEKTLGLNTGRKPAIVSINGKRGDNTCKKSLMCCKCQEVFDNKSSLALHFCTLKSKSLMKTYNRASKTLKSDVSKETVEDKSSYKVCQPMHTQQFICDICKQHFLNKDALTFHLRCHIEAKFVCEDCQTAFDTRKLLEIHRRSIGRKQFLCSICQKVFCCERNLINHNEIHNRKEKFSCDVCDKLFKNKFILYIHYFRHTKNVPFFICSVCLKIFSNRNNWISHCCAHMGTKPRICEICKKHFVKRRNFYLHCRIHTDEKPYICETCHKAFKYHNTLVMHLRSHVR